MQKQMRSADRGGLVRLRLEEGRAGMGREPREGGREGGARLVFTGSLQGP